MKILRHPLLAATFLLVLVACKRNDDPVATPYDPNQQNPETVLPADNDPLLVGNPTNAIADSAYPENFLKNSSFYQIGYSRSRAIPIWVGWHLQSEDLGSANRQDDFRADPGLPAGWFKAEDATYTGAGFDRGHNVPSADRTTTTAANSSTFLMSNIIPQAANLNQGPWENLENFIRTTLVGGNNEAYIFMGNYGSGGYGTAGLVNTISSGRVAVPSNIWKVVLVLPKGNSDLTRISSATTVLAVNMPNDNRLYSTASAGREAWRNYITTIEALELNANSKGVPLNLFKNVADSLKGALKSKLYQ